MSDFHLIVIVHTITVLFIVNATEPHYTAKSMRAKFLFCCEAWFCEILVNANIHCDNNTALCWEFHFCSFPLLQDSTVPPKSTVGFPFSYFQYEEEKEKWCSDVKHINIYIYQTGWFPWHERTYEVSCWSLNTKQPTIPPCTNIFPRRSNCPILRGEKGITTVSHDGV